MFTFGVQDANKAGADELVFVILVHGGVRAVRHGPHAHAGHATREPHATRAPHAAHSAHSALQPSRLAQHSRQSVSLLTSCLCMCIQMFVNACHRNKERGP